MSHCNLLSAISVYHSTVKPSRDPTVHFALHRGVGSFFQTGYFFTENIAWGEADTAQGRL
jgi:hypothetical protein